MEPISLLALIGVGGLLLSHLVISLLKEEE